MMLFSRLSWVVAVLFVTAEAVTRTVKATDWTIIVVALIAAVPATLASVSAMRSAKTTSAKVDVVSMNSKTVETKVDAVKDDLTEARAAVVKIELSVDGFMKRYTAAETAAARAEGIADERQANAVIAAETAVATAVVTAGVAEQAQQAAELREPVAESSEPAAASSLVGETARLADETARIANSAEAVGVVLTPGQARIADAMANAPDVPKKE